MTNMYDFPKVCTNRGLFRHTLAEILTKDGYLLFQRRNLKASSHCNFNKARIFKFIWNFEVKVELQKTPVLFVFVVSTARISLILDLIHC